MTKSQRDRKRQQQKLRTGKGTQSKGPRCPICLGPIDPAGQCSYCRMQKDTIEQIRRVLR